MSGLSRCGRKYPDFAEAIIAAEARQFKGSPPQEVVACGGHWHVQRKGTLAAGSSRPDPFPPAIRSMLVKRDECCQRCGFTGRLEAHHRRAKSSGGSSARSHTQCACNGVLLCRACHEIVHLSPRESRAKGWIVLQSVSRPETIPMQPIFAYTQTWYPTCDGGWNDQP